MRRSFASENGVSAQWTLESEAARARQVEGGEREWVSATDDEESTSDDSTIDLPFTPASRNQSNSPMFDPSVASSILPDDIASGGDPVVSGRTSLCLFLLLLGTAALIMGGDGSDPRVAELVAAGLIASDPLVGESDPVSLHDALARVGEGSSRLADPSAPWHASCAPRVPERSTEPTHCSPVIVGFAPVSSPLSILGHEILPTALAATLGLRKRTVGSPPGRSFLGAAGIAGPASDVEADDRQAGGEALEAVERLPAGRHDESSVGCFVGWCFPACREEDASGDAAVCGADSPLVKLEAARKAAPSTASSPAAGRHRLAGRGIHSSIAQRLMRLAESAANDSSVVVDGARFDSPLGVWEVWAPQRALAAVTARTPPRTPVDVDFILVLPWTPSPFTRALPRSATVLPPDFLRMVARSSSQNRRALTPSSACCSRVSTPMWGGITALGDDGSVHYSGTVPALVPDLRSFATRYALFVRRFAEAASGRSSTDEPVDVQQLARQLRGSSELDLDRSLRSVGEGDGAAAAWQSGVRMVGVHASTRDENGFALAKAVAAQVPTETLAPIAAFCRVAAAQGTLVVPGLSDLAFLAFSLGQRQVDRLIVVHSTREGLGSLPPLPWPGAGVDETGLAIAHVTV